MEVAQWQSATDLAEFLGRPGLLPSFRDSSLDRGIIDRRRNFPYTGAGNIWLPSAGGCHHFICRNHSTLLSPGDHFKPA